MKLVNADLLIKEISRAPVWTSLSVKEMINEHITYEVVRCRDCKRQKACVTFEGLNDLNGYCSMGERSE